MIPRTAAAWQTEPWQQQLARAFDSPPQLLRHLRIDPATLPPCDRAAAGFRLRVTREYAALMRRGDPDDPLLRQVWPAAAELLDRAGFGDDPVGDRGAMRVPGLLQKYRGRALLMPTGACAIHCRYCFRRHYPYRDGTLGRDWSGALEQLRGDPTIHEVILSGGDPLLLPDHLLQKLTAELATIPGLQTLRIHSRLPVVLPDRLSGDLTRLLAGGRLQPVLVLHLNHPREMSEPLRQRLQPLRTAGVTLLNQSVLLRGVNDDTEIQVELARKLFRAGILPYYLHLLDRVRGAAHFEVERQQALAIHRGMRRQLPGYLVPRLVEERAGEPYKTPVP